MSIYFKVKKIRSRIPRKAYIEKVTKFNDTDIIKIITGLH